MVRILAEKTSFGKPAPPTRSSTSIVVCANWPRWSKWLTAGGLPSQPRLANGWSPPRLKHRSMWMQFRVRAGCFQAFLLSNWPEQPRNRLPGAGCMDYREFADSGERQWDCRQALLASLNCVDVSSCNFYTTSSKAPLHACSNSPDDRLMVTVDLNLRVIRPDGPVG